MLRAGDDVAYFFKPSAACNAVVSLCGSDMATDMIVLSHVDQVRLLPCVCSEAAASRPC